MISNPSAAHDIFVTRAFFAVRRALKIRAFNQVGLLKHAGDNITKIYPDAHERISTLQVKRAVLEIRIHRRALPSYTFAYTLYAQRLCVK